MNRAAALVLSSVFLAGGAGAQTPPRTDEPAAPAPVVTTEAKSEGALQPTAATPAPIAAPAPPPKPETTLFARIDLTNQRLTVVANGKPLHTWPISSGAQGYETPTGTFRPSWMAKMWYSRKYDLAPMPHSVFFNGGIAVHATQATGSLGRPASHGCIRLAPNNAATFYGLVTKHGLAQTKVVVTGWPKFGAPAVARRQDTDERRRVAVQPMYRQQYIYRPYGGYAYSGYNTSPFGLGYAQPMVVYRPMPYRTR